MEKKIRSFAEFREVIASVKNLNQGNHDLLDFLDDCDELLDWCEEVNDYLTGDYTSACDAIESAIADLRNGIPMEWE